MKRLQRLSLASRLILATLLMLALTLPLAGLGLAQHFRATATGAFDRQLEALLNVVIAGVAWDDVAQQLVQERDLGDPRFERVFSGWYWQVSDGGERVLTSRSLWDQRLPVQERPEVTRRDLAGPRDTPLRVVERDIHLAPLESPLHVSVAAPRETLELELDRFTRLVALSLAGLGLLVLVMLALQVRWGLAPLRRLQGDLAQVENGDAERLDARLPAELARLAEAMNAVLARDRRLMEHARHAAGNLAHALKTPVSVLTTLADGVEEPRRSRIRDELARIDTAVRHHLARATAAGDAGLAPRIDAAEALAPILEGLGRLAGRRGVALEHELEAGLHVRMAPQDLQELVGNLLDNALRWANGRVRLHGHSGDDGAWLCVEDDGPGMNAAQRETAMARGARLDEQRSGNGLGLAIVADLVALHGGRLALEASTLGGLCARVWLPARPLAGVPSGQD
ncbi:HAMP domain-containing histidine kinase [Halomonas sp. MCCC 1A17488]|uniref:histidine kinase n=1 Tax=Billgrantia sulfidoxydans TaxID=2733484 RepID=A0ABX7W3D6_9GAMM|nr:MULTISPECIES: HAMP domain-containing sensor histidine kinase [Halomonas]MCE8016191.1 HAMP domain-containing histidine kinase [Halomonas sp. MCCC 1A17488]MCG3239524.1 HAMP domain-containing histidine kinase [Halomonas sp. MCCC 1A17488]QPP50555.1 HAMP domain-containing histidine kinase [Halomonas sp. SS10-MC5]QTP54142.1 HAMP domain-containing histidine kinase [Halomonas sulfidoxydans]